MSKFTCFVLCAVAVGLSSVSAKISAEDKAAIEEAIKPIIAECSTQTGVSEDDIKAAKQAGNADGINPCFMGCFLKKIEVFDAEGKYNVDAGLTKIGQYIKNDEDIAKFEKIAKQCASVNDQQVSDGNAGCERAKLLLACALEHKAELPI